MDFIAWIYIGITISFLLVLLSLKTPMLFPFGLYVFLLPFDEVLSVTGSVHGATMTKFLGILTILTLLFKGFYENKLKRPDSAVFWWLLIILYGAISVAWAIQPGLTISRIPTAVGLLLLYLVVAIYQFQRSEFEMLKWCILAGGLLAVLYTIYLYASGNFDWENSLRVSMMIGEREADPNQFAFSLILPVSVCIQMMLEQNSSMKKILLWISLGLILFSVIITGSRGGLLGVGVILLFSGLFGKRKLLWGISIVIITGVLSVITPEYFAQRFGQAVQTGGAGRVNIWAIGLEILKRYWLLGAGLDNFPAAYAEFVLGIGRAPHNIYLGIFVELGIIGLILLIFAAVWHYRLIQPRFDENNNDHVTLRAAFWSLLISSFFLDTLWRKPFWLLWMLILINANRYDSKSAEDETDLQNEAKQDEYDTMTSISSTTRF